VALQWDYDVLVVYEARGFGWDGSSGGAGGRPPHRWKFILSLPYKFEEEE
jgi:hypothetical protein